MRITKEKVIIHQITKDIEYYCGKKRRQDTTIMPVLLRVVQAELKCERADMNMKSHVWVRLFNYAVDKLVKSEKLVTNDGKRGCFLELRQKYR